MVEVSRRGLLGMLAAGAGAAIIRTPGLLMPVKVGLVSALPDAVSGYYGPMFYWTTSTGMTIYPQAEVDPDNIYGSYSVYSG